MSHRRFELLIFIFSVIIAAPASDAAADWIPPGEVKIHTADYRAEPIKYRSGVYTYDADWQGIPVGTAVVTVKKRMMDGVPHLFVEAKARTTSAIDLFYRLRHVSQSVFRADTMAPVSFYSNQEVNYKSKVRRVSFRTDGEILTQAWKEGKDDEQFSFHSDNLTLDPISAAFMARSLSVTPGQEAKFDVFNGKHRYLVAFDVVDRESTRVSGKKVEAFKIKPTVQKLTDTEGEKRLKSAFLWVSADGANEILKLESKVLIGSVEMELDKFEAIPDETPAAAPIGVQAKADVFGETPSEAEQDRAKTAAAKARGQFGAQ